MSTHGSFLTSLISALLALTAGDVIAQPSITQQPADVSASLGALVTLKVTATGTLPLLYQWRTNSVDLPGATNRTLTLTNVTRAAAGDYIAVIADSSGMVTSQVAHVSIDPTFTKIMTGSIVTKVGTGSACAWGDYNNDGFIDLIVPSAWDTLTGTPQKARLFLNNTGDGTFIEITNTVVTSEARDWRGGSWVDYDNDGNLDLFITSTDDNGFAAQNELFHNNGDGTFTKMTPQLVGPVASLSALGSEGAIWADYDRDGFVDLFIARYGPDWLFHNNGNGTFSKMTNTVSGLVQDDRDSYNAMWGDYDNDGWPDLYVAVKDDTGRNQTNFFYHNLGNGTFDRITSGQIATDSEHSMSCAWIDYDNDGNLDLFVVNGNLGTLQTNSLYHNNGDGTFTKMTAATAGSLASDKSHCVDCAWGDYDNDGYLDVFLTDPGDTQNSFAPQPNFLYHNNGDGSFTRVLTGSLANDSGNSVGCAWGDYDDDGFLDLFVARGTDILPSTNLLYHNNGNSNAWIKVKLVGTISNRSAIGAKVRVKATIRGKIMWQLREINTGHGFAGGDLIAHFGLGDATNVDAVRIEWPSGIVEVLTNQEPKQLLILEEPSRLKTLGATEFQVQSWKGMQFQIETSTNCVDWAFLMTVTNAMGTLHFKELAPPIANRRFYRAVAN